MKYEDLDINTLLAKEKADKLNHEEQIRQKTAQNVLDSFRSTFNFLMFQKDMAKKITLWINKEKQKYSL